MERAVGHVSDSALKGAFVGLMAWMIILIKASTSVRGWTKSIIKFAVYIATLAGIFICSCLLAIKLKMN